MTRKEMASQSDERQTRWIMDHEAEGIMLYEQTTTPPVTTTPVATIYAGQEIADLFASAPRLKAEHAEMRRLLQDFVRNAKLDALATAREMLPLAQALLARLDQGDAR